MKILVLEGFYCPGSAQTVVSDPCMETYYCLSGQNQTSDNICPSGLFCPNGSAIYQQCPAGTYTDAPGKVLKKLSSIFLC